MKKTKTILCPLLNGSKKRVYRNDIKCICCQKNIAGGWDVQIFTKSDQFFLTSLSYEEAIERLHGKENS